jgi:hypothetical protein
MSSLRDAYLQNKLRSSLDYNSLRRKWERNFENTKIPQMNFKMKSIRITLVFNAVTAAEWRKK